MLESVESGEWKRIPDFKREARRYQCKYITGSLTAKST